jgi:hypothetical protein
MTERWSSTATAMQTGASIYRQAVDFFQLRHETMLHGSLGAVARGRPAASIAETVAPI